MIIKTGIDIIKDERLQKNLNSKSFMDRVFHPSEQKFTDPKKYSSVFTLKESVFKALELKSPKWLEVEIKYKESGKTDVVISDQLKPDNFISADSSVSHEGGFTVGVVTIFLSE